MPIRFWIPTAIALGGAMPAGAADAPYPDRPVRVFVGLAPGGGTDSVARVLAQKLTEVFRQTFVIDNRPGAGGNVAGEMAARSAPDGHTLIVVTPTHVVNPSLYRDVRYDALKDFTPICLLVHSQYLPVGGERCSGCHGEGADRAGEDAQPAAHLLRHPASAAPITCRARSSRTWPASR